MDWVCVLTGRLGDWKFVYGLKWVSKRKQKIIIWWYDNFFILFFIVSFRKTRLKARWRYSQLWTIYHKNQRLRLIIWWYDICFLFFKLVRRHASFFFEHRRHASFFLKKDSHKRQTNKQVVAKVWQISRRVSINLRRDRQNVNIFYIQRYHGTHKPNVFLDW